MNSILKKIYQTKIEEIKSLPRSAEKKREWPVNSFPDAIAGKSNIACIAEIKKASPSAGIIRKDFNPMLIAQEYEKLPIKAVSVLTDEQYFHGNLTYLKDVKKNLSKPVLRKDFIIDIRQIYESYNSGADVILLIVAMLSKNQLAELYNCTLEIGMDALIEVHDENELEQALLMYPKIIGVNNRDLNTFQTSLETSVRLSKLLPDNLLKVAESGLNSYADIKLMQQNGFDAVLLGEVFMRAANIEKTYHSLFTHDQS